MPQFTVGLPGGGDVTVNATDQKSAIENAGGSGVIIAGPGAPNPLAGSSNSSKPAGTAPTTVQQQPQQLGGGLDAILQALQKGDARAFDESVREFDLKYGLDKDQLAENIRQFNQNYLISQAGLTGTYDGKPTMAQQQQNYAQQLGLVTTAASMQANPFRQQQVIGQMGNLLGGGGVAAFQAPNTVQGVGTAGGNNRGGMGYLQQMIDDIRDPSANQASMDNVLAAIPTPNKLNSTQFLRAAPSTQNMVLQGMQEKYGIDPNDALGQIKATLPQFTAPTTMGTFKR